MISSTKLSRFLFALATIVALLGLYVWAARIQKTLDAPELKGASSPGLVGSQGLASGQASGSNWRHENMPKMTLVAAGATLTFGTTPVPIGPAGLGEYWGDVIYTTDGVDASTNCDAGVCSGVLEMKIPVDIHGGQCCIMGGSICSTDGGGGLSSYVLNDTASTGVSSGAAAQILCDPVGQTLALTFKAGPNSAFWVGGIISHAQFASPSNTGVDAAGPDAADAADAADAGDAGPPPTIALVDPPLDLATGGNTVLLIGTNFVNPSFTIDGLAMTGVSVIDSTHATAVTPADVAQQAAGSGGTPVAVAVTTAAGTQSANLFAYLPTTGITYSEFHFYNPLDVVVATGVSKLLDRSGLHHDFQQPHASQQPLPDSGVINGWPCFSGSGDAGNGADASVSMFSLYDAAAFAVPYHRYLLTQALDGTSANRFITDGLGSSNDTTITQYNANQLQFFASGAVQIAGTANVSSIPHVIMVDERTADASIFVDQIKKVGPGNAGAQSVLGTVILSSNTGQFPWGGPLLMNILASGETDAQAIAIESTMKWIGATP